MAVSASVMPKDYPSRLAVRLEQEIAESIRLRGVKLTSSFPKIEALLGASSHFQEALGFVADREAMKRYRSVIDFLLGELCPEHAALHAEFLAGGGQLNARIEIEEMRRAEHTLFCAMLIAVVVREDVPYGEPSPVSWPAVVEHARDLSKRSFGLLPITPSH
jgi:hypothetical protein